MQPKDDACLGISIGIWNGSQTGRGGSLLYRTLLEDALKDGLQGGTAWRVIEGGNHRGVFRSIESEVVSNELPVWLQFIDRSDPILRWIRSAKEILADGGIIVLDNQLHGQIEAGVKRIERIEPRERVERVEQRLAGGGSQAVSTDPWTAQGMQVTIYTLEKNKVHGKLIYQAVAEYLRHRDVLWVATMRGLGGFGDGREIRQSGWFRKEDTPIMMVVVDKTEKLSPHLAGLVELVGDQGIVVSSEVTWVHP